MNLREKLQAYVGGIYEGVKCGADPNKYLDLICFPLVLRIVIWVLYLINLFFSHTEDYDLTCRVLLPYL